MITEDYVSFNTAKLLKAKGFNSASFYCYEEKEKNGILLVVLFYPLSNSDLDNTIESHKCWSAPTIQVVMKWLRENFNMNPVPYATSNGWYFEVFDLTKRDITGCAPLYQVGIPPKEKMFETYEEACEAAIRYTLENLI